MNPNPRLLGRRRRPLTGQVIERRSADLALLAEPDTVTTIVRQCCRGLDTAAAPPAPEAVEELGPRG
jgi:hypothetical protein